MNNSGNHKLVWQEASKIAPMLSPPLKGLDLVICLKWRKYGRNNEISFPRLGSKRLWLPAWTPSPPPSLWGKPVALLWVSLRRGPCGKTLSGPLWPTAHEELRFSVQQPGRQWVLPATLWMNLEVDEPPDVTAALDDTSHPLERPWVSGTHRN